MVTPSATLLSRKRTWPRKTVLEEMSSLRPPYSFGVSDGPGGSGDDVAEFGVYLGRPGTKMWEKGLVSFGMAFEELALPPRNRLERASLDAGAGM